MLQKCYLISHKNIFNNSIEDKILTKSNMASRRADQTFKSVENRNVCQKQPCLNLGIPQGFLETILWQLLLLFPQISFAYS